MSEDYYSESPDILDDPSWRMWRLLLGISAPHASDEQRFWWAVEYNWLLLCGHRACNPYDRIEKVPYLSREELEQKLGIKIPTTEI